ncbi:type II toxin-antitoxin system VapB family antitoxin [Streptomyces sp. NPDC059649]|uniref:type II toxin-antitoxin system VapB family antitoxin n=1 Tax=Streptomyces sp. NPDC059649 TaxID=3346895 RepID=UPI0036A1936E
MTPEEAPAAEMPIAHDEDDGAAARQASGPRPEEADRLRRAQALAASRRLAQDGAIDLDLLRDKRRYRPGPRL